VIYAEIPADEVSDKAPQFDVGKVYNIRRFQVAHPKSCYKVVDTALMIYITPYTIIELCHDPPSTFPSHVYRLTSYNDINPNGPDAKNFHGMPSLFYLSYL
jgi:hypothetical protein